MPGKKIYIGVEQLEALEEEAARTKIDVEDLIRLKLDSSSTDQETLENLLKAIKNLADRVQNCELILQRYCTLNEAELLDLGYLRGAIEVQASRKAEVVKVAEEREAQRLQLAQKVRAEIEQYLL